MEAKQDKDLKKLQKIEKSQAFFLSYIKKIGKWFLYTLPLVLVSITALALLAYINLLEATFVVLLLKVGFYVVAIIYGLNSIALLIGAQKSDKLFKAKLKYERTKGRPIESLDGFRMLSHNVHHVINLIRITAVLCLISTSLYIIMIAFNILEIGYAAIGFTLFGLGLVLMVRSLNLKIGDINGLQDFYKPQIHQIFLDNLFSDVLSNHLDPVTYLKWDEYKKGLSKILNPAFVKRIKSLEKREIPVNFAVEKMLYLYYLMFHDVITEDRLISELKEVVDLKSDTFDVEKGLIIENKWYFSRADFNKLFKYINEFNPGFFNIIDRLQLELYDNIEKLSEDKIYLDSSAQELVYKNRDLNVMVFLFNNSEKEKEYRIKVVAPGFEPNNVSLDIKVEGRGKFQIPDHEIPLTSSEDNDIVGVLSEMLENGDSIWITLEPKLVGEQTIQIFLEDSKGNIIEGKTRIVKVATNMKYYFKRITSLGSILGGLATPIARILFPL